MGNFNIQDLDGMVSVPRRLLIQAHDAMILRNGVTVESAQLRAILFQPAEQHQGEPAGEIVAFGHGLHEVAWAKGRMPELGAKLYTHPAPAVQKGEPVAVPVAWMRFDADQRALFTRTKRSNDSQPLYDHPTAYRTLTGSTLDAGEVERLRNELGNALEEVSAIRLQAGGMQMEIDELGAKLAERDALLRETYEDGFRDGDRCHERGDHFGEAMESGWLASDACKSLSASAEPSAPKCEMCSDHGIVGNILNAEPCPDCSYSAPVERDGLEGVEDVAASIGARIQARAALERKPAGEKH